MKRNPSRSATRSLTDELAELRRLDLAALKQRWRVLYRSEAPVHIGQALLLQAVAYRLQEGVLGGLKRSTRRLLERAAQDNVGRRSPTETPATEITPGGCDKYSNRASEPTSVRRTWFAKLIVPMIISDHAAVRNFGQKLSALARVESHGCACLGLRHRSLSAHPGNAARAIVP